MKTFAFLLTCAAVFASTAFAAEPFRIATFNLNWGNRRGDQILDAIAQAKPDIICFQETTPQSERFLRKSLSKSHPHFHAVGHDGRLGAERFAFASDRELSDLAFTPPTGGLFGFYAATTTVDSHSVRIINVHLTPVVLRRGEGIRAAMNALSDAETTHQREIDAIIKTLQPGQPTIILGDFNSITTFAAPTALTKLGFIDSFAKIHDDPDKHATWTWPTRPLPLSLRIDHIFHTTHFTTSSSEIIKREGSDHFLVISELLQTAR